MAQPQPFLLAVEINGDQIETAAPGTDGRMLAHPAARQPAQPLQLSRSQPVLGRGSPTWPAGLDFDEYKQVSPAQYKIDLATRPPVALVQQAVTARLQKGQGDGLAGLAQTVSGTHEDSIRGAGCRDRGPAS